MLTFDLLNQMDRLQEEMNRLFSTTRTVRTSAFPALNIWTGDDHAYLTAELPGIDPTQLDISVNGNELTLKGVRPESQLKDGEAWIRQERDSGTFVRTFEFPFRVESDKVEARYSKGVLYLTLPRAEAEKPKKIQVRAA